MLLIILVFFSYIITASFFSLQEKLFYNETFFITKEMPLSKSAISKSGTVVAIFWGFLLFYQFFLSVKWSVIISNENGIKKLPPELRNDCGRFVDLL